MTSSDEKPKPYTADLTIFVPDGELLVPMGHITKEFEAAGDQAALDEVGALMARNASNNPQHVLQWEGRLVEGERVVKEWSRT